MTIDEAIKNSQHLLKTSSHEKSPDSWDAIKLGIEALKYVQRQKPYGYAYPRERLPGETKD